MPYGSMEPGPKGGGGWGGGPGVPAGLPWALSHEPLTINNGFINELFAYLKDYALCRRLLLASRGWYLGAWFSILTFWGPF